MTNFQNFATVPLQKYAGYFRNHGCLWIFQHIPKTAGSSVTRELSGVLPPYCNIHLATSSQDEAESRSKSLMKEVDSFIERYKSRRYSSASGHLRQPHLRRICESLPHAKIFSFLREPAERLISDYRYAKTPKHPPHQEFSRRYPTIESYIDDPSNNNKMWRFVRPGNASADKEALSMVFRRYAFFGTVSRLEQHFQFLTGLTTCPKPPRARINVTTEQTDNSVALSADLRSRIEQANTDDYNFYTAVKQILDEKSREIDEFINDRRGFYF